jgi:hypothetical protein
MNRKYQETDKIGNKNPFTVPEGYFENLNLRIQERLKDVEVTPLPVVNLWSRVKPWLYMVAMFAGIALIFKIFSGELKPSGSSPASEKTARHELFENENIDDVLDYLETRTVESSYREAVYIGE